MYLFIFASGVLTLSPETSFHKINFDTLLVSYAVHNYDSYTGNLSSESDFKVTDLANEYRKTVYEYVTNTSPSVWILNTLARRTVQDAHGIVLSEQKYGYNGNLPGVGSPTTNKPDLSRVVNGTQTIDIKYLYDAYGNVYETDQYKDYGTSSSQPSGTYLTYSTGYAVNDN